MAAQTMKKATQTAGSETFMAFVSDEVTHAALVRIAGEYGWSENQVVGGGLVEATRVLGTMPTPRILVVDVSDCGEPLDDLMALAEVCDEGARVIVLGTINDVNLFRALMDMGIDDYMLKPVSPEALDAVIRKVLDAPGERKADAGAGRMIVVVGARGGIGTSTVATNCAWLIAREYKRRVALVDLDLYFGTTALALDLEPGRGFREALENPSRIDDLFMERAMVRESEFLHVLCAEEALENSLSFDPAAVNLLLEKLRRSFDRIVVDVPHASGAFREVLSMADTVMVVSDLSLAGMRDTMRLAGLARTLAPDAEVKVVANRVAAGNKGEMTQSAFEKGIETKLDYLLPEDAKSAAQSAATGRALVEVAKKAKIGIALRKMTSDFVDTEAAASGGSLLNRLLKRGK